MSTPYKYQNSEMSVDELDYHYMNSNERSKVIEETKQDWMLDYNNKNIQGCPFLPSILKTDFDVILASVKYDGLALSVAAEELSLIHI